ncbi:Short-chain dehydrogenase reductase 3b [Platanthera zijinensis]|uniref:Short-chain dehydrogenase reductase 3b n=1 Tax=Platanthera zijinensis TaxID=2320716 RepID=A0AAP0BBY3_9ASPA
MIIVFSSIKLRLEGKVVVITGGVSGIREAVVSLFVTQGTNVIITDIQDTLDDAREELQVAASLAHTVDNYGRIDIMLSNIGIVGTMDNLLDHKKLVKIGSTFLLEEATPPQR